MITNDQEVARDSTHGDGASWFPPRMSDEQFSRLSRLIQGETGIRLPRVKKAVLEARAGKRLRALGHATFREYCAYLFDKDRTHDELLLLIDAVTTNKTEFFREAGHFEYLSEVVLTEVTQARGVARGRRLMVWSAGCATGEEAYSLAMVLSEFARDHAPFDFHVVGTDISTDALSKARAGVYAEERIDSVPEALKVRYFLRSKDRHQRLVRVAPELRECVSFGRLNLMDHEYGVEGAIDVIFCRNVIIYFEREVQSRVVARLAASLRPGGYLFLGHSETVVARDSALHQAAPTVHVARRTPPRADPSRELPG